jgi:hypothetical protein
MSTSTPLRPAISDAPALTTAFPRILSVRLDQFAPAGGQRPVPVHGQRIGWTGTSPPRGAKNRDHTAGFVTVLVIVAALGSGLVVDRFLSGQGADNRREGPLLERPLAAMNNGHSERNASVDPQSLFLVRSTLMALNDANRSGNYSVLRDLAGPQFQARNTAAVLSKAFAPFRIANLDLSAAGVVPPRLMAAGVRPGDGVMALEGELPLVESDPGHRLRFAMEFEPVQGHWRLLTLSVNVAGAVNVAGPR